MSAGFVRGIKKLYSTILTDVKLNRNQLRVNLNGSRIHVLPNQQSRRNLGQNFSNTIEEYRHVKVSVVDG